MTQSQTEIYQELINQGMGTVGSRCIAERFKNQEQEHIMMEYLKSIREKTVSQTEVGMTSIRIAEM